MFIISCLTNLIKQRIAVPELIDQKWKNYLIFVFNSISILCVVGMTFYNDETLKFSHAIDLVDNILFLLYLLSSFIYSVWTYDLLTRLNVAEMPKDNFYLLIKKYLIVIMGVQLFCCNILYLIF